MNEITLKQAIQWHYWKVDKFGWEIHVHPLNDWQAHKLNADTCNCRPTVKHVGFSTMYVHNSYDGREEYE